jgi:hypothetical protein
LKNALDEVEAEIGRVMDAIRIRGFDSTIGQVLNSLEAQRKAIALEIGQVSQRAPKSFLESAIQALISSIRTGDTIPEINQHMRLVFKSLVLDDPNNVLRLTLVDDSQTFIAID